MVRELGELPLRAARLLSAASLPGSAKLTAAVGAPRKPVKTNNQALEAVRPLFRRVARPAAGGRGGIY